MAGAIDCMVIPAWLSCGSLWSSTEAEATGIALASYPRHSRVQS